MAEVLVLRLGESAEQSANWIVMDSSGARVGPPVSGPMNAAQADTGDRRLIVLVPATDVLTTTVDIPLKSQAKIHQALPFALEEFLADDVDELHFAAGARRESGSIPVAVINREKLKACLAALDEANVKPDSLIAENYGLACIPGTISLLIADDKIMINDGADTELVMQGVGPAEALAAIGAFDEGPSDEDVPDETSENAGTKTMPRHVLVYCEPEGETKYAHDFIALRHDFESVDVKVLPDGVLPRLAATVATGAGVNLLQGEFGARTEYGNLFRPWRSAAALILALGATAVAGKTVDYFQLSQRETALREQFIAEYSEIAPGTDDVRDPVAVISSLRARTGGGGTPAVFLQSLEQISLALQKNADADVQAISYRAGIVDIRISAPSVSVLDNVRSLIDESGTFEARIQTTSQDDDRVNSRIQIQAVGQ